MKALALASLLAAAPPLVSSRGLMGYIDKVVAEISDSVSPMIVGGSDVTNGQYDFFVQGDGCGGSLVASDVVLTAGHCKSAFRGSSVIVGNYEWGEVTEGAEQLAIVSRMYIHPNFVNSWNTLKNDLMLFKIAPSSLTPININGNNSLPVDGQNLTVIGFGAVYEGGGIHDTLQKTTLRAVSYEECSTNSNLAGYDLDETSMLCASVEDASSDSCQGDSGGPLFDEGTQTLMGVVSWGLGCARPNSPGVYSRVSGNIGWVLQTICQLTDTSPSFCEGLPPSSPLPPAPSPTPADDYSSFFPSDDSSQGPSPVTLDDIFSQADDGAGWAGNGTDDLNTTDDFFSGGAGNGTDDASTADDFISQTDDGSGGTGNATQGNWWFDDDLWDFFRDDDGGRP